MSRERYGGWRRYMLAGLQSSGPRRCNMRCTRLLAIALLGAPLFGQLQNRPQVLQLSLKQAVDMALAPEGQHAREAGRGGLEAGRVARR